MPKGILFWLLMILWFICGLWWYWPLPGPIGINALLFTLLALLGWQVFGKAIQ